VTVINRTILTLLTPIILISLWPHHVDALLHDTITTCIHSLHTHHLLPSSFTYQSLERASNIALYIPVGYVIAHLNQKHKPVLQLLRALTLTLLLTNLVELTQTFLLPDRTGDPVDILTNTIGGILGILLHIIQLRRKPTKTPS
jgi:VanZ family protein